MTFITLVRGHQVELQYCKGGVTASIHFQVNSVASVEKIYLDNNVVVDHGEITAYWSKMVCSLLSYM